MAFDGIVIANLVKEFRETILNGRINKIAQPERDELLFTMKGQKGQVRLLLSANASLPLVYLTATNKPSPLTAPNFCMLLRKHIANGRIIGISQPGLERIIRFDIEHLDELGDLRLKRLIIEIMGKHSNIIFCDEEDVIIDSIKHISGQVSSVREVLPGRTYFIPDTQEKVDPLIAGEEIFFDRVCNKPVSMTKAIYGTYMGISPVMASELCFRALVDGDLPVAALQTSELTHLYRQFRNFVTELLEGNFSPNILKRGKEPVEFSAVPLTQFADLDTVWYDSISQVLEDYFAAKSSYTRMRQKSVDLRRIVGTALDRNRKKYELQEKQLTDTEKRDKYKVYGELLHAYGYGLEEGAKELEALNYYSNKMIRIPLDPQLTAGENAKKYFDRYNKLKRTFEALTDLIQETESEIRHLESIASSLDIAGSEDDLMQIKEELVQFGYIKKRKNEKKIKLRNNPLHYISSDGYHIYIGKNNFQNEELTFKFANGSDWWFHAKGIPGSHVVVKGNGETLPDGTFEEAGRLAAYYSKGRDNEKVEIDYIERKHVKKPKGGKPGFVVYYTNFSLTIDSDISGIQQLE
jgi:predicted ribosome quality control (RQC) complex YloA/Tae2 family protein